MKKLYRHFWWTFWPYKNVKKFHFGTNMSHFSILFFSCHFQSDVVFFWKNHSRYLPQVQQYGWWNFCSKQDSQNIQTWSSQGWERSVFLDQTNSFTLFNLNFKGIKIFMTTFLKVLKDCMKAICCSLPLQFPLLFSNYSHEQKWYGCEQ